MGKQSLTAGHWFLALLAISGVTLIFTSLLPSAGVAAPFAGPLRVSGLALLFVGIGEFLNRPLDRSADAADTVGSERAKTSGPARTPCALGNLFIIFSIICAFAAASLYFFPHDS